MGFQNGASHCLWKTYCTVIFCFWSLTDWSTYNDWGMTGVIAYLLVNGLVTMCIWKLNDQRMTGDWLVTDRLLWLCFTCIATDRWPCIPGSWLVLLQQGVRFDPDLPQTIRLEFAKSNTKVSKPKPVLAAQTITQPPLVHPLTGRK